MTKIIRTADPAKVDDRAEVGPLDQRERRVPQYVEIVASAAVSPASQASV